MAASGWARALVLQFPNPNSCLITKLLGAAMLVGQIQPVAIFQKRNKLKNLQRQGSLEKKALEVEGMVKASSLLSA